KNNPRRLITKNAMVDSQEGNSSYSSGVSLNDDSANHNVSPIVGFIIYADAISQWPNIASGDGGFSGFWHRTDLDASAVEYDRELAGSRSRGRFDFLRLDSRFHVGFCITVF